MNMMLKSMREASSSEDNPFDNEQSRTFGNVTNNSAATWAVKA